MTDGIRITPSQVQDAANLIKGHAKNINQAIVQVDSAIKTIIPGKFEGRSADFILQRYNGTRDRVFEFSPFLESFANNLNNIADTFIAHDKL